MSICKACRIILSIDFVENEPANAWIEMLKDLTMRSVENILFLCSDNLTGIDKAVEAIFPKSIPQVCIVHQIRDSLKFVSYKDKRAVMNDIKAIYINLTIKSNPIMIYKTSKRTGKANMIRKLILWKKTRII